MALNDEMENFHQRSLFASIASLIFFFCQARRFMALENENKPIEIDPHNSRFSIFELRVPIFTEMQKYISQTFLN